MNLVQKLPIGFGLACVMSMSSCSKEDAQTPVPQTESVTANSNLREGVGIIALPQFPSTMGATGLNVLPMQWERKSNISFDVWSFPTGTSNFTHLWGNPSLPWVKSLGPLPTEQASGSVITLYGTPFNTSVLKQQKSEVFTKLKNLKPGKKYVITMYGASTIPQVQQAGKEITSYAKEIRVSIDNGVDSFVSGYTIPLKSNAGWQSKVIVFEAKGTEATLSFAAKTSDDSPYGYGHVFVDKNSIQELN